MNELTRLKSSLRLQEILEIAALNDLISWQTVNSALRDCDRHLGVHHPIGCPDDDPELNRLRRDIVVAFFEAPTSKPADPSRRQPVRRSPWASVPDWQKVRTPW